MVQTEAQKRAKAKYYAKLRENEEYKKNMAQRTRDYYQQNKEKHLETCKKYYEINKSKLVQENKEKRQQTKLMYVISKLETMNKEVLAKILIDARKIKLLESEE